MAGLFSSAGLFGTNSTPAQVVTTNPYEQMQAGGQSGNFGDLANTNSTYLADLFSQLGTGQAPSYYQKYQNQAMPYQQNLMQQQYFGTPGNRGNTNGGMYGSFGNQGGPSAMGQAQNMAAMYGLNPQQGIDQMSKVNQQYQNSMSAIDQYFAGQGLNTIQKTAEGLPGWATGQQNALTDAFRPTTNVIPAQAGSLGLFGNMVASQASALNNMIGFNGLNNMFGGSSGGGVDMGTLNQFGGGTAPYAGPSASQMAGPMQLAAMAG